MYVDWFEFWSRFTANKKAIITAEDSQKYSFGQINKKSKQLCAFLLEAYNINKGDRIGIIAENCIEYIYLLSAAQKIGFIIVPLNYRLTSYETEQLLEDASLSILIVEEKFKDNVPENFDSPLIPLHHFTSRLDKHSPLEEEYPEIEIEDPIFILYTSGSTGKPKGVFYTHEMMLWNSVNTTVSLDIHSEVSTVICMPPFHTGGWNVLLTPILHHGGLCILMKNFDSDKVLQLLSQYECTQFMGVPTMLKMMSEKDIFEEIPLDKLNYILVGGEAMPMPLIKLYEKKGIYIRQGYGMTEVGPNLTSLHHSEAERKAGSIGKPNMYVEMKLVDPSGKEVERGNKGEICFRGPLVTPGYWNNKQATEKNIRNGWLHTGDVAIEDDEGFLFLVDRIKNMYISGGENVYPAEVESVLLEHPEIDEIVIIGVPDDKWGEVGKAFIKGKHKDLSKELILEYCLSRLSKYKIPKHFAFLDEIPKTATGKVDRQSLNKL